MSTGVWAVVSAVHDWGDADRDGGGLLGRAVAALHQRGVGGIPGAEQVAEAASTQQGQPMLHIRRVKPLPFGVLVGAISGWSQSSLSSRSQSL